MVVKVPGGASVVIDAYNGSVGSFGHTGSAIVEFAPPRVSPI